jgi:hypothetical protein
VHGPECGASSRSYVRRRPEESALYRAVERHLASFVDLNPHILCDAANASAVSSHWSRFVDEVRP